MTALSLRSIRAKLQASEWKLVQGSVIFSAGMALAGLLGFAFSVVVASSLSPVEYGAIQYAIALGSVVAIGTQPFGQHVIARFVGKYKDNVEQLQYVLSNFWVILIVLSGTTLLLGGSILFIIGMQNIAGILFVFSGVTVFYIYWGLARGFLVPGKLTIAYLAGNILQLSLAYFVLYILNIHSVLLILSIYGLCFILPPIFLQILCPLPINFQFSFIKWEIMGELFRFSIPIWISHGCYVLLQTMDILLLEYYFDTEVVGIYAITKTLANVSLYLPTGIATFLMPMAAGSPEQAHRQMLTRGLVFSLVICICSLVVYLLLGKWFVMILFGPRYNVRTDVMLVLAFGMILQAANQLVTAVLVGGGRPSSDTLGRISGVCFASLVGWITVPIFGQFGAALMVFSGSFAAFFTYVVLGLFKSRIAPIKIRS